MGGKQSKGTKRFRVSKNLSPVPVNYEDDLCLGIQSAQDDDLMNDPTYRGEPDLYINKTVNNDDADVWVPREGSETTCMITDDVTTRRLDSGHSLDLSSVLSETAPDHYDLINESEIEQSETELKRVVSARPNRDYLRPYHKLPKRRQDYEQMVKIFQPLIVTNVIVRRLLPHLPFLSDPDRIRAVEERDPRAAVIYLIDELCCNKSTEPGRWKQFIHALEVCGYKYIVETLRGQEPVDHTYQREYLKIITPVLRELIEPSELLPILWASDVISNEDKEEIGQVERNLGATNAADKLLDLVPRRHKFWYAHLVDALKKVDKTDAAEILAIPEILNSEEGKEESCERNEEPSKEYVRMTEFNISGESHGTSQSQYLDMNEPEVCSYKINVPDNCEYLDRDEILAYSEDEEYDDLDDLYRQMRCPNNPSEKIYFYTESVSKQTTETTEENQIQQHHGEHTSGELASNRILEKFPSDCSLTNDQGEHADIYDSNETLETFKFNDADNTTVKLTCNSINEQNLSTVDGKTNNLSDTDRYEPPLPPSAAPETPGHLDVQGTNGLCEVDGMNDTDVSSLANDVEVVKLSAPEQRKSHIPSQHFPAPSRNVEGLNKPPMPTPRNRATINKRKPDTDVQSSCATENKRDCYEIRPAVEDEQDQKMHIEDDEEDIHSKKTADDPSEELETVEEALEATTCAVSARLGRVKVKASILKRKKKVAKFQRSKLNRRRKPLHIPSKLLKHNHTDGVSLKLNKGNAITNGESRLTSKIERNSTTQADEDIKSKSLPIDLRNAFKIPENTSKIKEGTDRSERSKDETCDKQFYYSEPFRCHRGKEDEDIFTTVGQVPKKRIQPLFMASGLRNQRRMSETDELLDILEACNLKTDDRDYILKSSAEIKTVSKDNLSPELRKHLEKLRDLKLKLNHLVHDGKVLEKRLELQEDVNEVLKRNRQISSKLSIKEKEAKALEAAISGDVFESEEYSFVPTCNQEISTNFKDNQNSTTENEDILKVTDREIGLLSRSPDAGSTNVYIAGEKYQLENVEKDSAFYSEFTTKL